MFVWATILASALFLAAEWRLIRRMLRIDRDSLATIEKTFVRIPTHTDVLAANVLTVFFLMLSVQFVAKVYAMSFTAFFTTTEINDTVDIIFGDFDGDGDLDSIAGNTDSGAPALNADIYRNDSGTFSHIGTADGFSQSFSKFAAADIDNDGDLDIVYAQGQGTSYTVGVKKNNGSFSFSSGYSYSYAANVSNVKNIAVFDVDNDGDLDIVAATSNAEYQCVHINDGHGNFTIVNSPLPATSQIIAADFNSDGYMDLAIANGSTNVRIYKNSGTGSFTQLQLFVTSTSVSTLAPADIDGDGDIDILAGLGATPSDVEPLINDGTGNFSSSTHYYVYDYGINDFVTGDFDNNGSIDFMDGSSDNSIPANGVEVWGNDGAGSFSNIFQVSGGDDRTQALAVGDIDGDGDLDFVRGNGGGSYANIFYTSDQAATSANTAPTAPSSSTLTGSFVDPSAHYPGTAADDNSIGNEQWNNVSSVLAEDATPAVDSSSFPGDITHYLKVTNFNFHIPTNATILGVKAEVKKKRGNATFTVNDYSVKLVVGGSVAGNSKADATTNWPTSLTYVTYGGSTDTWGNTLDPSYINASNFGMAIAAINNGIGASSMAQIDVVRLTVYYSMRDVRLTWGSGSDTQTPTRLLQYQVKVGTGSNSNNIVSGVTASPNYVSRIMPNGQSKTYLLKNLPCGNTFYWNVATVDTGFKKTWGTEQTFTIDSSCGLSFSGGGGSSGGSSTAGGGISASFFNRSDTSGVSSVKNAVLTVSVWNDVNGDGIRQENEQSTGFRGLPVTASGSTADGTPVNKTLLLTEKGTNSFDLPPSDGRGYDVWFDSGSAVLKGFEPVTDSSTGGIVLREGQKKSIAFGVIRSDLLRYKPCLEIGEPDGEPPADTDPARFLIRLRDSFGKPLLHGLSLTGSLTDRRTFLEALTRTQCLKTETDEGKLTDLVKKAALNRHLALPLIDLPLNVRNPDALLIYNLLALNLPAERGTLAGPAADLSSPITRREAINLIFATLDIPEDKVVFTGATLPIDLDPKDPILPAYLTLRSLGILPQSFTRILSASQGLNPTELSAILARSAFRGGKVPLTVPTLDQSARKKQKNAKKIPTFLTTLPSSFKLKSCLEKDSDRAKDLSFVDVLPGDSQSSDIAELLTRSTENSDERTLWLLPGTLRPVEFGVDKGLSRLNLDDAASVLETIRSLLVLSCLPPYTLAEVKDKGFDGSLNSKIPRDMISNLPRDTSLASRILFRAEDHQRLFDLSLFTYAPELLRKDPRSPASPFTVEEGASFLASALLRIAVTNQVLTPQAAEAKAQELKVAILKDFVSSDDLKDPNLLQRIPLTRAMLLKFLSTVSQNRTFISPDAPSAPTVSVGEIWWTRVK